MALVRSLAIFILAVSVPGCALAISGPDPQRPKHEPPKCDTGKGLVILDGLWATLATTGSISAISDGETGTGVALAGLGALFIASAYRGNKAASQCEDAFGEYNASLTQAPPERVAELPRPARKQPKPIAKPIPKPVVQPEPAVDVPPANTQPPAPTEEEQQPPAPAVAPQFTTPRPPPPKPSPPPKPAPPDEEDWSFFWKELP